MSFRDDLKLILAGGLPAVLEFPQEAQAVQNQTQTPVNTRVPVEQSAPAGTIRDREPFLQTVTQNQILTVTALAVGALGLLFVLRK